MSAVDVEARMEVPPGKVSWSEHGEHMDAVVQEALDNPRVGDAFHEMYSYGVHIFAIIDDKIHWRSFSTKTLDSGVKTREEWRLSFRYGDHMPGQHTLHLLERGPVTS